MNNDASWDAVLTFLWPAALVAMVVVLGCVIFVMCASFAWYTKRQLEPEVRGEGKRLRENEARKQTDRKKRLGARRTRESKE